MPPTKPFPVKRSTQEDYHARIEKTVDLIRRDPSRAFTVGALADEAAFSEFHFHRVFKAMTGETVAGCISRLRSEAAASKLVYSPTRSITDIAHEGGFSSSANFAKAFRIAYGCSPTQYRQNHTGAFRMRRIGKASTENALYTELMIDDVETSFQPKRTLASLRLIGAFTHARITRLYEELGGWFETHLKRPPPDESINITWSDTALADEERWRLDACYAVPENAKSTGKVIIRTFDETLTARLPLTMSMSETDRIGASWDWFLSVWLPAANATLADQPAFETYRPAARKGVFDVALHLPLISNPY